MSNLCIIPARALLHPELTGTDIRVLCAIGLHTDRAGAGCWASSKTLCEEASVSRNHFFISTKRLLEAGLIRRISGQDTGGTSTYSVILDDEGSTEIGTGGVTQIGTGVSPKTVRGSRQNRYAPTINAPLNVPSNAPTTAGAVSENAPTPAAVLAWLRRQRIEERTPSGIRYRIPADALDNLPRAWQEAVGVVGGLNALANADDTGLRVMRGQFARECEARTAV